MDSEILLFIIKLAASGIVSFLAILLMSKKREAAWTFLVCGFLFSYAALIYELLTELGVLSFNEISAFGIPLTKLICAGLPSICFALSFIIMLAKHNK